MIHQSVIKKVVSGGVSEGWYPPADWGWDAASALISDTDDGFVALVAVYPNIQGYFAFMCTFLGTGTVVWGDGTSETVSTGVNSQHAFTYANIPGSITSNGFKIAVVIVKFTSTMNELYLNQYHTNEPVTAHSGVIGIKIRRSSAIGQLYMYEGRVKDLVIMDVDFPTYVFQLGLRPALKKVIFDKALPKNISLYIAFYSGANIPILFNELNYQNITSLESTWQNASGVEQALDISIPSCTSLNRTFLLCEIFKSIILTDTGLVSNMDYGISGSTALRYFTMDDCASVTSMVSFCTYSGSPPLEWLILAGLTIGVNISSCRLSATALNAFFTALGTANGAQTITVTGNPGAATCDTSIATAKGFTVVT